MNVSEIIGTILTVLFVLMSVLFISAFWSGTFPVWFAVVGTIGLGAASIWACWEVGKYWYNKIKNREQ